VSIFTSACAGGLVVGDISDNSVKKSPLFIESSTADEISQAQVETTENRNSSSTSIDVKGIQMDNYDVDKDLLQPAASKGYDTINEWYIDEDGTEYSFDRRTGDLTGILKPYIENQPEQAKYSLDEMCLMADSALFSLADAKKWKRVHDYDEDTRNYYFYYSRIESGYETTEGGMVAISNSGHIRYTEVWFVGMFDTVTIPEIKENELDAKFDLVLRQQYNDVTNYIIIDRVLDYKGNQLVMRYEVEFTQGGEHTLRDQIEIPV